MIRVTAHLISAIDASRSTELARLDICNDGATTLTNPRWGSYVGVSYRGRDRATLDRGGVSKRGVVTDWPRTQLHVWNLVQRMLCAMGYDQTAARVTAAGEPVPQQEPVLVGWRRAVGMAGGNVRYEFADARLFDPAALALNGWEPLYTYAPAGWADA